ncbi:ArsR/SmtB family transcription factor [Mameliella sp.]|uniref:ArsR/SmtB family transcription factor n=1 Tax=Mameliella sp. TaxID=1924940 RepID=UPI003B504629
MTDLTASLSALADPTRREIIAHLARGEATVSQLVEQFDLTQPTISSHLKVLEGAGLVLRTRVAQTRPCRLNPDGLKTIADWLKDYEQFWQGTLDHFAEHAERHFPDQKGTTDDR